METRYFSRSTNTEITREEAVSEVRDGLSVSVGYRAKWDDRYADAVEVFGKRERARQVIGPEVNWSALGSVTPGEATAYAALIAAAARLAADAI